MLSFIIKASTECIILNVSHIRGILQKMHTFNTQVMMSGVSSAEIDIHVKSPRQEAVSLFYSAKDLHGAMALRTRFIRKVL